MEFIHVTSADDFQAKEIYQSYTQTFPADERRNEAQFKALFTKPKAKVFSVLNGLDYIGYLIAWELTGYIFIEHFEIFSEFRSQKFGSEVISDLFKQYNKIILESEPEDLDDVAKKRIEFYQRNGFSAIDKNYVQPAYEDGKNPVNLWLMGNYQPEHTDWIREEIYDVVYCK